MLLPHAQPATQATLPRQLQVRLNYIDHYQSPPTPFTPRFPMIAQTGSDPNYTVPVVRVFGSTESGQRICVHVHGVFPYIFIEADGSAAATPQATERYLREAQTAINEALGRHCESERRRRGPAVPFVAHLELVKGIPFFGFHVGYRIFLKISLLKPYYVGKLSDLLLAGSVFKGKGPIQPFEKHLQYRLQWMCDYNLYGCAFASFSAAAFREPVPSRHRSIRHHPKSWHAGNIPPSLITLSVYLPRVSNCELEVDVCAWNIMNRLEIQPRNLHHHFIDQLGLDLDRDGQKQVPSLAALWRDESLRRGYSHTAELQRAAKVTMTADPYAEPVGFLAEDEYRREIDTIIERERGENTDIAMDDLFVAKIPGAERLNTVFESVTSLFPIPILDSPDAPLSQGLNATFMTTVDLSQLGVTFTAGSFAVQDMELTDPTTTKELPPGSAFSRSIVGQVVEEEELEAEDGGDSGNSEDEEADNTEITMSQYDPARIEARKKLLRQSIIASQLGATFEDLRSPKLTVNVPPSIFKTPGLREAFLGGSPFKSPINPYHRDFEIPTDSPVLLRKSLMATFLLESPTQPATPLTQFSEPSEANKAVASALCRSGMESCRFLAMEAPPAEGMGESFLEFGLPEVFYPPTHYSTPQDVPTVPRTYGGHTEVVVGTDIEWLPPFDPEAIISLDESVYTDYSNPSKAAAIREHLQFNRKRHAQDVCAWEYIVKPPSYNEVAEWLERGDCEQVQQGLKANMFLSQIDGPTPKKVTGYRIGKSFVQEPEGTGEEPDLSSELSLLSIEVIAATRGELLPNPSQDSIVAIAWSFFSTRSSRLDLDADYDEMDTDSDSESDGIKPGTYTDQGLILLESLANDPHAFHRVVEKFAEPLKVHVRIEHTELDLLNELVSTVLHLDPDVLLGYDIVKGSWGYVLDRAQHEFELNIASMMSRLGAQTRGQSEFSDSQGSQVVGRHIINLWRAMKGELTDITSFTVQNVAQIVLHLRVPAFPASQLFSWFCGRPHDFGRSLSHVLLLSKLNIEITNSVELISRTVEQARLVGIDFSAVYGRGSQFKVESLMFRLAKAENLLLVSPSAEQVSQQRALECVPLIMEPRSRVYRSPIIVLDFQSLYPSMMIAYNYCYSTCLGRLYTSEDGSAPLGFSRYQRPARLLERIGSSNITVAPNELMFTRQTVRRSLLARMLSEILETRVMIKSTMAADSGKTTSSSGHRLSRLRHSRQLALKLIANVTYGYASASFSGRMPCAEIADSIVQTGRETVERAIGIIEAADVPGWAGAEVVYGDTDSIFVHLPGRSAEAALKIGKEMAQVVSEANPRPVKLQFEKVYHPAVLLTKKRYAGLIVGKDGERKWDAKGIESVRRDGTPASRKIVRAALTELMRAGGDLSPVRRYVESQCTKLLTGRIPIVDLCYARSVRPSRYSGLHIHAALPPNFPPGLAVALRRATRDPRAGPQEGERVPYVIVRGQPGAKLLDRAVDPAELLGRGRRYEIDSEFYITHNILPPLDRVLELVGASATGWYEAMPKPRQRPVLAPRPVGVGAFFRSAHCVACGGLVNSRPGQPRLSVRPSGREPPRLCEECSAPGATARVLAGALERLKKAEGRVEMLRRVCQMCQSRAAQAPFRGVSGCVNTDCEVRFKSVRAHAALGDIEDTFLPLVEKLNTDIED